MDEASLERSVGGGFGGGVPDGGGDVNGACDEACRRWLVDGLSRVQSEVRVDCDRYRF